MKSSFKETMSWLHTWSGVVLGSIMFVIFFMGTLSIFAGETDQWFWPQARHAGPTPVVSLDRMLEAALAVSGDHPDFINLIAPTNRAPVPWVIVSPKEGPTWIYHIDPNTYEMRGAIDSAGVSQFLYPMHYRLQLPYGRWIVGFVSMFMVISLISGIIIHKKIFADFFTFRRDKKMPRRSLDLHNLTAVIAMPFHLMITVTGILIFSSLYLQPALHAIYPGTQAGRAELTSDAQGFTQRPPSGETHLRISSIDAMRTRAERYWHGQPLASAFIVNPHDADGYVSMSMLGTEQVQDHRMAVHFDVNSGATLAEPEVSFAYNIQTFIVGMHEIHFDHQLLRWLYFLGGVAGSVMIATGYIYWLETRRLKHSREGGSGLNVVEALTIWGVMGLLTATAAFFVVNQLLPRGAWSFLGVSRIFWEVIVFYIVWFAAIPHGALRKRKAWFDQSLILAGLCSIAPVLNWTVTGDHLLRTIVTGQWAIAGVDLMLLGSAGVALYAARRLKINETLRNAGAVRAMRL